MLCACLLWQREICWSVRVLLLICGYEVCVVIQRRRSQTQAAEFPLKGGRARSWKQNEELGFPRRIQSRAAAPCRGAS